MSTPEGAGGAGTGGDGGTTIGGTLYDRWQPPPPEAQAPRPPRIDLADTAAIVDLVLERAAPR